MLKEKFSSKKRNVKIKLSKYPVNKEIYETMSTTVDSESNDNKIEGENNIKQLEMKLNESHFEDAFRKVSENEVNKKNELVKKQTSKRLCSRRDYPDYRGADCTCGNF